MGKFVLFILYISAWWKLSTAEEFRVACVVKEPLLQPEDESHLLSELCTDILFQKPSGVVQPNAYQSIDPIINIREKNPDIRLFITLDPKGISRGPREELTEIDQMIDNILNYLKRINAHGLNLKFGYGPHYIDDISMHAVRRILHDHGFSLAGTFEMGNENPIFSNKLYDSIFVIPSRSKAAGNEDWEHKLIYDASNITEGLFLYRGLALEKTSIGLPSTLFLYPNPEPSPSRSSYYNSYDDYHTTPNPAANMPTRRQLCKDTELKGWRPKVAINEQLLWSQASSSQKFAMQFRSSVEDQLWTLQRLGAAGIVLNDLPYAREENPICRSQKMLFVKSIRRAIERMRHPRIWRKNLSDVETSESQDNSGSATSASVDESNLASQLIELESGERTAEQVEQAAMNSTEEVTHHRLARSHDFEEDDSKIDRFLDQQLRSMHSARGTDFYILSKRGEYEEFQDFFQMDDSSLLNGPVVSITLSYDNVTASVKGQIPDFVTENRYLLNILNKYVAKTRDSVPSLLIFPNVQQTFPVPILIHWTQLPPTEPETIGNLDESNESSESVIVQNRFLVKREDKPSRRSFGESATLSWSVINPKLSPYKPYNPSFGSHHRPVPFYYSLQGMYTTRKPVQTTTTRTPTDYPVENSSTVSVTEAITSPTVTAEDITTESDATTTETLPYETSSVSDETVSDAEVSQPVTTSTEAATVDTTSSESTNPVTSTSETVTNPTMEATSDINFSTETTNAPFEITELTTASEPVSYPVTDPTNEVTFSTEMKTSPWEITDPTTAASEPVTNPATEATSEVTILSEATTSPSEMYPTTTDGELTTNPTTEATNEVTFSTETTAPPAEVTDPATETNPLVTNPATEATSEIVFGAETTATPAPAEISDATSPVTEVESTVPVETTAFPQLPETPEPPTFPAPGSFLPPTGLAPATELEDFVVERMLPRRANRDRLPIMADDAIESEDLPESRLSIRAPTRLDTEIAV